jgi:hypothetical protein
MMRSEGELRKLAVVMLMFSLFAIMVTGCPTADSCKWSSEHQADDGRLNDEILSELRG